MIKTNRKITAYNRNFYIYIDKKNVLYIKYRGKYKDIYTLPDNIKKKYKGGEDDIKLAYTYQIADLQDAVNRYEKLFIDRQEKLLYLCFNFMINLKVSLDYLSSYNKSHISSYDKSRYFTVINKELYHNIFKKYFIQILQLIDKNSVEIQKDNLIQIAKYLHFMKDTDINENIIADIMKDFDKFEHYKTDDNIEHSTLNDEIVNYLNVISNINLTFPDNVTYIIDIELFKKNITDIKAKINDWVVKPWQNILLSTFQQDIEKFLTDKKKYNKQYIDVIEEFIKIETSELNKFDTNTNKNIEEAIRRLNSENTSKDTPYNNTDLLNIIVVNIKNILINIIYTNYKNHIYTLEMIKSNHIETIDEIITKILSYEKGLSNHLSDKKNKELSEEDNHSAAFGTPVSSAAFETPVSSAAFGTPVSSAAFETPASFTTSATLPFAHIGQGGGHNKKKGNEIIKKNRKQSGGFELFKSIKNTHISQIADAKNAIDKYEILFINRQNKLLYLCYNFMINLKVRLDILYKYKINYYSNKYDISRYKTVINKELYHNIFKKYFIQILQLIDDDVIKIQSVDLKQIAKYLHFINDDNDDNINVKKINNDFVDFEKYKSDDFIDNNALTKDVENAIKILTELELSTEIPIDIKDFTQNIHNISSKISKWKVSPWQEVLLGIFIDDIENLITAKYNKEYIETIGDFLKIESTDLNKFDKNINDKLNNKIIKALEKLEKINSQSPEQKKNDLSKHIDVIISSIKKILISIIHTNFTKYISQLANLQIICKDHIIVIYGKIEEYNMNLKKISIPKQFTSTSQLQSTVLRDNTKAQEQFGVQATALQAQAIALQAQATIGEKKEEGSDAQVREDLLQEVTEAVVENAKKAVVENASEAVVENAPVDVVGNATEAVRENAPEDVEYSKIIKFLEAGSHYNLRGGSTYDENLKKFGLQNNNYNYRASEDFNTFIKIITTEITTDGVKKDPYGYLLYKKEYEFTLNKINTLCDTFDEYKDVICTTFTLLLYILLHKKIIIYYMNVLNDSYKNVRLDIINILKAMLDEYKSHNNYYRDNYNSSTYFNSLLDLPDLSYTGGQIKNTKIKKNSSVANKIQNNTNKFEVNKKSKNIVCSYVTDVEGDMIYFENFVKISSIIDWTCDKKNRLKFKTNNSIFVFGGDTQDKGCSDIRFVNLLLKFKDDYPERVIFIIGNRDANKLRIPSEISEKYTNDKVFLKKYDEFPYWINKEKRVTLKDYLNNNNYKLNIKNRLNYILEYTMGCKNGSFERRRRELSIVLKKNINKISDNNVISSYINSVLPIPENISLSNDNYMLKYLKQGHIVYLFGEHIFVHGSINDNNIGIIPNCKNKFEDINLWAKELNNWFSKELQNYISNPEYGGITKKRKANNIIDYVVPATKNNISVIYSDNLKNGNGCNINKNVIYKLKKYGIRSIISGHKPHGDCPLVIRNNDFVAISADTSCSNSNYLKSKKSNIDDMRGNAVQEVLLYLDGTIKVHGILADNRKYKYIIKKNNDNIQKTSNDYIGIQLKNKYWVKNVKNNKFLISYGKGFELDEKWINIEDLKALLK